MFEVILRLFVKKENMGVQKTLGNFFKIRILVYKAVHSAELGYQILDQLNVE